MEPLILRNPHAVTEAIKFRPKDVREIRLGTDSQSPLWAGIEKLALANKIPVKKGSASSNKPHGKATGHAPRGNQSNQAGREGLSEAWVTPKPETDLPDILPDNPETGIWFVLDQIQDPQNLGAIFRVAAFFGVRGIITTLDRSAPLSAVVYDVAAGGVEHVPYLGVQNLQQLFLRVKKQGYWCLGTSEHEAKSVKKIAVDQPWLVCLGNEEKGLRRLTLDECDERVAIQGSGELGSLNVGTAAAILAHHFCGK